MKTPYFWKGMSFTAKAGYLCATRQARDYSEACAKLARRRKTAKKRQVVEYWWNKEGA